MKIIPLIQLCLTAVIAVCAYKNLNRTKATVLPLRAVQSVGERKT